MTTVTNSTSLTMEILNSQSLKKIFHFELFKVKAQDKEDVKQDCIIRILKALKTLEVPEDKIPSFCQTIIKRTVVDYYRQNNRKIEQNSISVFFCDGFGDEEGFNDTNSIATYTHATKDYGYDISDIRVEFEMNRTRFTPIEQDVLVFMLYHKEGLDKNLSEIAKELQVNKSHTTRAFKKLREVCST